MELPDIRAPRGGIQWGAHPNPPSPERIALRERSERLNADPGPTPRGRWAYGADLTEPGDTEPEIASTRGAWSSETYDSLEEATDDWPDRPIVRRWIPAPTPWEALP
ncbi:hypothetical protein QDA03_gp20 [Microbacterium phage Terij]|uniref:Uncharacterized protein n=1 Tax=Microbacterium phage Terij TaxID=2686229 RepID=A0A6B9LCZ1_9CAUD|nr:hypothetical protein QDA03_gp20 [Microbacterium phage Terij]QHB37221.1 hypothetical protein SEA_TERIJ_87 [Microbacterium phage Terij]